MKGTSKQFEPALYKYIVPSMSAMFLSSCYVIVDGLFIGRALGDQGLAAVNIIWPIEALVTSLAGGVGISGAIYYSICMGSGQKQKAIDYRSNTLVILFVIYLFVALMIEACSPFILHILGARGEVYALSKGYTDVFTVTSIFQLLNIGLNPFLRNGRKPLAAMMIQVTGMIINIVLVAVFVMKFRWAIAGAGLATAIAQLVAMTLSLIVLTRSNYYPLHWNQLTFKIDLIKKITKKAVAPFGEHFSPSLIIIMNNFFCLHYGGAAAMASYSVINYSFAAARLMLQGIGDGIQPIVSYFIGARKYAKILLVKRKSLMILFVASFVLMTFFLLNNRSLPVLFGTSDQAARITEKAIIIYLIGLPFIGFERFSSSFFNAINETGKAMILNYLDPLIVTPLCLFLMTFLFDMDGIWLAFPVSQMLLASVSLLLFRNTMKRPQFQKARLGKKRAIIEDSPGQDC